MFPLLFFSSAEYTLRSSVGGIGGVDVMLMIYRSPQTVSGRRSIKVTMPLLWGPTTSLAQSAVSQASGFSVVWGSFYLF